MEERYSYKIFFQNLYLREDCKYRFIAQNCEEVAVWRADFRAALRENLGLDILGGIAEGGWGDGENIFRQKEKGKSFCVQQKEMTCEEGYLKYRFVMETLPDVFMPFYMLMPEQVSVQKPAKAMIAIPAHGSNKDVVSGTISSEEVREKLKREPESAYGLEMVKQGYVVFCPDPPGYGQRLEPQAYEDDSFTGKIRENPLGSSCKNLALTAQALGLSFQALVIWDLMRLVDFISERPEVIRGQIGCAGFSGGGQYAMWLAAMDERILAAAVSGYVHGYYESIMDVHLCPCNYAPGLWKLGDISDICSLIAPRPLFVENGIQDPENGRCGIDGPAKQVARIRKAYEIYGKGQNLKFVTPQGKHRWYGLCYDFLNEAVWSR